MSHGRTEATLFSGFEGFGVGARAAGYRHLWGVEWSARIAGVADRNGFTSIVANVCNVDYSTLEAPYHLHASPVCKNASIAKTDKGETAEDIATGDAVCRAIEALRPVVFTLENVRGYLHFEAFKRIVATLRRLGYGVTYDVLNSADYGVPQTRERVIFVGTRSDMPEFVTPAPCTPVPITAKEALADLESHPEDRNFSHVWSEAKVSGEQGNRHLVADRPGYTMRAECHGNIQFHYALPRRISMREAARIQSFPDSFRFASGIRATERQIGNAVPPVLAEAILIATTGRPSHA